MNKFAINRRILLVLLIGLIGAVAKPAAGEEKPKVAVFPISGTAPAELREKIGFSIRAKLDRDGHYAVIDGPTMAEIAGEKPIDLKSDVKSLQDLVKDESPAVLIWGEVNGSADHPELKIRTFEVNQLDPLPHEFSKTISAPTDMRFVVEDILTTLDGIHAFEHPVEESVSSDAASKAAFDRNPNLVQNGDFSKSASWEGLLRSEIYTPPISDTMPDADKVVIYKLREDGQMNNVLAMNLSKDVAESNGLACLSAAIPVKADTRYRLIYRYRSDGPTLHVFVKGYTLMQNIEGKMAEREVYRRQVPPSDETHGQWVTITDDLNPQNIALPVDHLRVDLYAYLKPGIVMFDDVQLKEVGPATHHAKDAAIKLPSTHP